MSMIELPDTGYCIAKKTQSNYYSCFRLKRSALVAARKLAKEDQCDVELVRVTDHGEDRRVIQVITRRRT